jgi:hypothetical protein
MTPIIFRLIERMLDVLAGALSIYLGFRLFFNMPMKTDSTGKIILPGNVSVYMSRIGPGIYFALFGSTLIALSLHSQISYTPARTVAEAQPAVFHGVSPAVQAAETPANETRRALLAQDIALLNGFLPDLRPNLPAERRVQVEQSIPRIKLGLMKSVWAADWGDVAAFERWTQEVFGTPPPAGLEKAAQYYSYKGGRQ